MNSTTMENLAGYVASVVMGLLLGLIGGGGSILTIPVLVYLFHIEPTLATAYSLFIVGVTALIGSFRNVSNDTIDFKSALLFSLPSTIAVFVTRHTVLPAIPENIGTLFSFTITKDIAIMIFFSVIMLMASVKMIRDRVGQPNDGSKPHNIWKFVLIAVGVGLITGLVGAGGGFLIVPALIYSARLPMKKAVGTSLIIITVNSVIGFIGDMSLVREINFPFLIVLSGLATAGVIAGSYLTKFIRAENLKATFGWVVLTMSVYILIKEVLI